MAKQQQKIIITASYDKQGNISVTTDFYPKMPQTMEEFNQMPEDKKGLVAIINQFAKQNQLIIQQLQSLSGEQQPAQESASAVVHS